MKQYIDKDIIKAELERKKIPFKRDIVEYGNYPTYLCALMDFEDFIDSLEVKEVTTEKTDWSPSKKQMESLKDMLKWNIGDFNYQKWMEVNSLYNDLTKMLGYETDRQK